MLRRGRNHHVQRPAHDTNDCGYPNDSHQYAHGVYEGERAVPGGTESDFQAAFGAPTLNASQSRHYETTIAGTHILVIALVGAGGVTDRKRFLRIAPADQGVMWSAGTGETLVKQFLPPDSTYQKDKQTQAVGTEHVYLSQLLGASFPPSDFADIDTDAPLTPGTFDYYCGGDVNVDGGCALLLLGA